LVFAFLSGLMLDPVRISFFIFYFVTWGHIVLPSNNCCQYGPWIRVVLLSLTEVVDNCFPKVKFSTLKYSSISLGITCHADSSTCAQGCEKVFSVIFLSMIYGISSPMTIWKFWPMTIANSLLLKPSFYLTRACSFTYIEAVIIFVQLKCQCHHKCDVDHVGMMTSEFMRYPGWKKWAYSWYKWNFSMNYCFFFFACILNIRNCK
jgi:hypothetical protein